MASLPLYMVDYACFNAPQELKVDFHEAHEAALKNWKCATHEKMDFVAKIFNKSGISSNMTAIPACILPVYSNEPKTDLNNAQSEAQMVYGQVIGEVLRKTGLKPTDIDILLTNTSVYCPTPSIASMVVNMFKMREDIECYHMGGMGCAFGVLGLNLARDMLIAHPGKICLFVSSEILTSAFYPGERKEALVTNALFRMGGSAVILTNNPTWRGHSKYQLQHCVRVHTGASDRAFNTLNWEPDENGVNGLVVTKTLPGEAAVALEKAMRKMAPKIMTWGQYAEAAIHYTQDYAAKVSSGRLCAAPAQKYQPDFTRCADHFLLHAGGYAILRGIQKGLRLPADKMMPSFASLRDFGNTSSSSTWYTWSYLESTGSVAKSQTVLQVGVGGGMKSGVAYWRALRSIKDIHPCWAHLDGVPIDEADLPRPISNDYKSVFDLPSMLRSRSQEEQKKAIEAANSAPRVSVLAAASDANKVHQQQQQQQQQQLAAARVVNLHAAAY